MVEITLNLNTVTPKEQDMVEEIDLQETIAETVEVVVAAGELIRNPMSKMKEKEEMAAAEVAGAMMMVVAAVEAITGVEAETPIYLLHNLIVVEDEAVEAVIVVIAVKEAQ
jgi:hypothetical protein